MTHERTPRQRRAKRSREKGCAHEREVAEQLRALFPDARRGIGQARSGGEVADVTGVPFWVECKHRKVLNVHTAYDQGLAARGARSAAPVLVVTRKHGSARDLATVELPVLLAILRELNDLRAARSAAELAAERSAAELAAELASL